MGEGFIIVDIHVSELSQQLGCLPKVLEITFFMYTQCVMKKIFIQLDEASARCCYWGRGTMLNNFKRMKFWKKIWLT
jgi:hypothetical protein